MAAKKQSAAAPKQQPATIAVPTPEQKLAHYDSIMESLAKLRAEEDARKAAKAKEARGIPLSKARQKALGQEATKLALMFAAMRRLSWEMGGADRDLEGAAAEGIEALGMLGSMKADYIALELGDFGAGQFSDDLQKLAHHEIASAVSQSKRAALEARHNSEDQITAKR